MKLIALSLALGAAVAAGLMLFWPDTTARPDMRIAAADLAQGETLYSENCASCHGANLEGQENWRQPGADGILPAPPHDETGHTWHHDDAMLFDYTKQGGQALMQARGVTDFQSGMPGFGDKLSDPEIRDILAYIKSTWPEKIRRAQSGRSAQGG
ncbi:MAG: cytochrome c [Sediminimonas qiaohouensis]|uniref:Cytochrome c n=1 Tax=Sediminimonas qiaohouensis TaxID=552061 RepID=A0A7C9HBY2_9RHOB|nr:cytochrome c [Sediminimonas qiaohouensis]MTJ05570.1 cytochrome c [Sediminimonas qiaohouensis]